MTGWTLAGNLAFVARSIVVCLALVFMPEKPYSGQVFAVLVSSLVFAAVALHGLREVFANPWHKFQFIFNEATVQTACIWQLGLSPFGSTQAVQQTWGASLALVTSIAWVSSCSWL